MKKYAVVIMFLLILLVSACVIPKNPTIFIDVYRSSYTPKLDPAIYADYKGKTIIFDSIRVEASNASMLGYYSPDRNVRYTTNYEVGKMPQPIESFLWYALQKSFATTGIMATNENIADNALNLQLTFTSIDDQEAKFQMKMSREGNLLAQKDMTVTQILQPTIDPVELEKRSYTYIDAMAASILNDADLKRELLTDKLKTNP